MNQIQMLLELSCLIIITDRKERMLSLQEVMLLSLRYAYLHSPDLLHKGKEIILCHLYSLVLITKLKIWMFSMEKKRKRNSNKTLRNKILRFFFFFLPLRYWLCPWLSQLYWISLTSGGFWEGLQISSYSSFLTIVILFTFFLTPTQLDNLYSNHYHCVYLRIFISHTNLESNDLMD